MLNLDLIQRLIELNDAQPVRVTPARCLNARHKGRQCHNCLGCPTDAITLVGGTRVELAAERCVACGLCASVCPPGAFTLNGSNDAAMLDAMAEYANVEFACPRATTTRAPAVERVMTVACLARVSRDLLVALAAEHSTVWLNDSLCGECPIGARAHPRIAALSDAAKHLLAAWERDQVIQPYTGAQLAEPRALTRAGDAAMSRREMFAFLRGNTGRAAGMFVAAALGGAPRASAPSETKPLERALTKLGEPTRARIADARFATLEVAAYCTACGLCAKICPTRALEFRADGGYFVLGFQTRDCLGAECSLCKLICPANAITFQPGARRATLMSREQKVLRTGSLTVCGKCQTPFATEPGELFCPVCRTERAKRDALTRALFKKESNESPSDTV